MSGCRVAVVGATGAVGTVMLEKLRERGFPAREIVPFASERSAGPRARRRADRPARSPTTRSRASTSRSSRPAATTSREWAPRFAAAGCRRGRQLLAPGARDPEVPLVVAEVNPEALDGHQRHHRQPELLDDAADGRAQADPRRGRDRAPDRLDLPVGVGHRRQGGRGARGPDPRASCTGWSRRAPEVYPHQIAFNVLGGAGNFPDGDDHTDEERKMMFETRKILGDESIAISVTCARVPVTYCALGVGQRCRRASRSTSRRRARCSRRCPG